jgi:hypothetical protein
MRTNSPLCAFSYKNTGMMPYVGAETPQDWLKTSLVKVPSGTPSTPSQYG